MAAPLLIAAKNVLKKRRLPTAQILALFYSERSYGLQQLTLHEYKKENHEKSYQKFLTCAALFTSSLACLAFYNSDDERKQLFSQFKEIILPPVFAKDASGDNNKSRNRNNFIADVVEVSAPAVVYIEIKDQKR